MKKIFDFMKQILGVLVQYFIEIIAVGFFLVELCCVLITPMEMFYKFAFIAFYAIVSFVLYFLRDIVCFFAGKVRGRVLYLTRFHEISMFPRPFEKTDCFFCDIELFLEHAKEKKIKKMKARTHRVMVIGILAKYGVNKRLKFINNILDNLKVGEMAEVPTTFGRLFLTYVGKEVNNCNRYKKDKSKKKKNCFEKIKAWYKKVTEFKDTYKLVFVLEDTAGKNDN